MPLKIIYLIVRLVAALAVLVFRRDLAKETELLVLRRANAVLRRHAGRIPYEPAGRVWFAALARLIPRGRGVTIPPPPDQLAMPKPGLTPSELARDLLTRIEQGNAGAGQRPYSPSGGGDRSMTTPRALARAGLDQAFAESQPGQVGAATAAGLVPDPVQVRADGADADVQLPGDLRVGAALGDQGD